MRQASHCSLLTFVLPWSFYLILSLLVTYLSTLGDASGAVDSDGDTRWNLTDAFANTSRQFLGSNHSTIVDNSDPNYSQQNNASSFPRQTQTTHISGTAPQGADVPKYDVATPTQMSPSQNGSGAFVDIYFSFGHRTVEPAWTKTKDLAFLPGIMVICLLILIFLRCCKWYRDSSKFEERGCSYDVTSYLILEEGDTDYDSVRESACHSVESLLPRVHITGTPANGMHATGKPTSGLYSTVTSSLSLQQQIDAFVYDTATSYKSFLQRMNSEGSSDDRKVVSPLVTSNTGNKGPATGPNTNGTRNNNLNVSSKGNSLKELQKRLLPGPRKLKKDSVRTVIPVLDNYIRLKTTQREHARPARLVNCGEPKRVNRFEVQALKVREDMGSLESNLTRASSCSPPNSPDRHIRALPLRVSYNPVVRKISRDGKRPRAISLNDGSNVPAAIIKKPRSLSVGTDAEYSQEVTCYSIPENKPVLMVDSWVQTGHWLQSHDNKLAIRRQGLKTKTKDVRSKKSSVLKQGHQTSSWKRRRRKTPASCVELYDINCTEELCHSNNGVSGETVCSDQLDKGNVITVSADVHVEEGSTKPSTSGDVCGHANLTKSRARSDSDLEKIASKDGVHRTWARSDGELHRSCVRSKLELSTNVTYVPELPPSCGWQSVRSSVGDSACSVHTKSSSNAGDSHEIDTSGSFSFSEDIVKSNVSSAIGSDVSDFSIGSASTSFQNSNGTGRDNYLNQNETNCGDTGDCSDSARETGSSPVGSENEGRDINLNEYVLVQNSQAGYSKTCNSLDDRENTSFVTNGNVDVNVKDDVREDTRCFESEPLLLRPTDVKQTQTNCKSCMQLRHYSFPSALPSTTINMPNVCRHSIEMRSSASSIQPTLNGSH